MKEVYLCIYDDYTKCYEEIMKAQQVEIDKITTKFEDKKELIEYLTDNPMISDIKVLNIVKKEKTILYKWHIKQLEEIAAKEKFFSFLEKEYPGHAQALDQLVELQYQTLEQYYKSIRSIYDIYEENYKKLGLPSLEKIYQKYRHEKLEHKTEQEEFVESLFRNENYQYKKSRGEK